MEECEERKPGDSQADLKGRERERDVDRRQDRCIEGERDTDTQIRSERQIH